MKTFFRKLKKIFPLLVILTAFIVSAVVIASRKTERIGDDVIVIRLAHWQLENGVRQAFEELMREYERLHPNVKLVQEAMPGNVYPQWLSTQFIARTTPDLVQMIGLPYQQMVAFYNRYCIPFTPYIGKPNPYNAGTDLEGVPWRKTLKDGLASGYISEMQEYMAVALSRASVRIIYNKDMLKKLTGRTEAPKNFKEFCEVCDIVQKQIEPVSGKPYVPVAGSASHIVFFDMMYDDMTYGCLYEADADYDGYCSSPENFAAILNGRMSFEKTRPIQARFQVLRKISDYCQPGFTGLSRDDGVFLFVQQHALFIIAGTWDALSLIENCQGNFEPGIMELPMPDKDDPLVGDVIYGPQLELTRNVFQFALTRTSKHPEIALDFLHFLTSQKGNERFNEIIQWIPLTHGAKETPMMKQFVPKNHGIPPFTFGLHIGANAQILYEQLNSLFEVNQISYEELGKRMTTFLKEEGLADFEEAVRNTKRGTVGNAQIVAALRLKAFYETDPEKKAKAEKFCKSKDRNTVFYAGITNDTYMQNILNAKNTVKPYEFTPEALENIKDQLRREAAESGK